MARQWVYWATVFNRRYLQPGTASVELFIDPAANLMAEVAISAYQDGGAGARISAVNEAGGLVDDYYFGDGVRRIQMTLVAVGGNEEYLTNLTRARMVVREYDDGGALRMESGSSMKSIVYDRDSGDIMHSEEVVGPEDRLKDFAGGKLEARAHDFVRKTKMFDGKFEVMPVGKMPELADGRVLKVDVKKQELVSVKMPVKKLK